MLEVEVVGGPEDGRKYYALDNTLIVYLATSDDNGNTVFYKMPIVKKNGTRFVYWNDRTCLTSWK